MDLSTEELSELKKFLNYTKDDMDEEKYLVISNTIDKHFILFGTDKSPIKIGETFKYKPYPLFTENALMFILEKHKNFCKILSKNENLGYKYPSSKFTLNLTKKRILPKPNSYLIDDIKENFNLEEIASQFNFCIKNGIDIIALPLEIPKHANALIYRFHKNTFEHYEPNGLYDEFYEKVNFLLNQFIEYLTENRIIRPGAILVDSLSTCPRMIGKSIVSYIDDRKSGIKLEGLQQMEGSYTEKYNQNPKNENKIPEGLCQIWSIFYLDLCLTFPYTDGDILINIFINKIKYMAYDYYEDISFNDDPEKDIELRTKAIYEYMKQIVANFIYGYYIYITENISGDYEESSDEESSDEETRITNKLSLSLIKSRLIKIRLETTKDFTCLNILNMSEDVVYEFLDKSPDKNHVILNMIEIGEEKDKTPIICSSRDYNKVLNLNGNTYFKLNFRTSKGEKIIINKSQMDIIKNKEYTFFQLKEEKKQKFPRFKTFYITKLFTLEDFKEFD